MLYFYIRYATCPGGNFGLVLAIALDLAMVAFAVSVALALGPGGLSERQAFRLAFHFGVFQFLMPVIGWGMGKSVLRLIESVDHWVAFALLLIIGGRMIHQSLKREDGSGTPGRNRTKGFALLALSVATSIDALGVGLSLAALQVSIFYPAPVIGAVALLMTLAGTKLGLLVGLAEAVNFFDIQVEVFIRRL